jgi:hypothetical protein
MPSSITTLLTFSCRQFVHGVQQGRSRGWNANRARRSCASRPCGDRLQGLGRTSSSAPSIANSFWYCLINAFFGSMRISTSACLVELLQGRHHRQAADKFRNQAELDQVFRLNLLERLGDVLGVLAAHLGAKADAAFSERLRITLSRPSKAPPQTNRILVVSTWTKSWFGCLRPPCGGTEAVVPSISFSKACCTPSPDTSRVIDGLSDLREILSISSM